MAIKVAVQVREMEFDGVTLSLQCNVRAINMTGFINHAFAGLAANIPNAAAMLPYIKGQVVTYMQQAFELTVVESEIAVTGGPM